MLARVVVLFLGSWLFPLCAYAQLPLKPSVFIDLDINRATTTPQLIECVKWQSGQYGTGAHSQGSLRKKLQILVAQKEAGKQSGVVPKISSGICDKALLDKKENRLDYAFRSKVKAEEDSVKKWDRVRLDALPVAVFCSLAIAPTGIGGLLCLSTVLVFGVTLAEYIDSDNSLVALTSEYNSAKKDYYNYQAHCGG